MRHDPNATRLLACLAVCALLVVPAAALAPPTGGGCGDGDKLPEFLQSWQAVYPTSQTDNVMVLPASQCNVCHLKPDGGAPWNAYGWQVRLNYKAGDSKIQAILNAASYNSDGDPTGATNLEEITAGSQPGWTPGPNNTVYSGNGSTTPGEEPPAGINGPLDPTPPDPWTDLGFALAGTNGPPVFAGSGSLQGGTLVSLDLTNAVPGGTTYLVLGLTQIGAPFKGGVLIPSPDIVLAGLPLDGAGALSLGLTWPAGLPSGVPLDWQHWIPDPGGPVGFAASNALECVTP